MLVGMMVRGVIMTLMVTLRSFVMVYRRIRKSWCLSVVVVRCGCGCGGGGGGSLCVCVGFGGQRDWT